MQKKIILFLFLYLFRNNLLKCVLRLGKNRVVFNIKGNDYRLITAINYDFGIVYIRFIGIHKEYDKIKTEEI
jgi:mRNA-degrading endonuclease HigB of HigAB toxin-antitoxin module